MTVEQTPPQETETSPLHKKHMLWLKRAGVVLESLGVHMVVGLSATAILTALGADLPQNVLAVLPTPTTLYYMRTRLMQVEEQYVADRTNKAEATTDRV